MGAGGIRERVPAGAAGDAGREARGRGDRGSRARRRGAGRRPHGGVAPERRRSQGAKGLACGRQGAEVAGALAREGEVRLAVGGGRLLVLRLPGADRLQLRLEEELVDLALMDRHALLEAHPDHFLPVDAKLLRQLLRRQVVRHVSSTPLSRSLTKKPATPQRAGGLSGSLACRSWRGSQGPPPNENHVAPKDNRSG